MQEKLQHGLWAVAGPRVMPLDWHYRNDFWISRMARKPALTSDSLKELGLDKLTQLVLSEAEQNSNFARLVAAAFRDDL
jgi:hypothetical protein